MNKVKMLKTVKGSDDGINVTIFKEGCEYNISDELLNNFIMDGVIEIAQEEKEIKVIEPEIKKVVEPKVKKKRGKKK